ncbi:hypothetical protein B0H16DRAFT_1457394 [Mycena metata]|uniref:Uncharacterized protein n=1 Tax=Mycena metata TaxID=1033252 RepID=A0AAD7J7E3_9AGAR|nr:hypothetical protein B0H16DRAFT_1457394 [Mycena metata]
MSERELMRFTMSAMPEHHGSHVEIRHTTSAPVGNSDPWERVLMKKKAILRSVLGSGKLGNSGTSIRSSEGETALKFGGTLGWISKLRKNVESTLGLGRRNVCRERIFGIRIKSAENGSCRFGGRRCREWSWMNRALKNFGWTRKSPVRRTLKAIEVRYGPVGGRQAELGVCKVALSNRKVWLGLQWTPNGHEEEIEFGISVEWRRR